MVATWKELGFRSYDAYINSRLWWNIRQIVLERDGKCCQVCGTPSKIVHHIDYTIIIMLGKGDQHDLITLCEPCHNFVEQDKKISEKKTLLNQLFGQYSKNTLDEWQIWAKQFNTDIGYDTTRLFESKGKKKKNKKHKTKPQKIETTNTEPIVLSLRDEIDYFIKEHKKKPQKIKEKLPSQKEIENYLKNKDAKWLDNKVKYYNKLHEQNIKQQLHKAFPYFIDLLLHHQDANEKLLRSIYPYSKNYGKIQWLNQKLNLELNNLSQKKETFEEKRLRLEEQYQRRREKKKAKIKGKLPAWTTNHKAKSFQGSSPLLDRVKDIKNKQ